MSNVVLRPFTREEYHDFYQRYEPDPLMDPNPYRYRCEYVDRCFDFEQTRMDWYPVFGIFDHTDQPVGSLAWKRIDTLYKRCELGIVMADDSCKNRGFGTEAIRQAIEMARERYGLEQMLADTTGSNLRMQHVLEKLGFTLVSRTAAFYDMKDRWEDRLDYIYYLTRKE